MGDCCNSIFLLFLPFLAKKFVPYSRFSDSRFFKAGFLTFCEKSGTVPGQPFQIWRLGCIFLFLNRIFFREIQESVGFLRNPQDFKNSCRKMKKCSCFWGWKRVPFLTPEYRKISQESGFTLLCVGINMFLKGWTPILLPRYIYLFKCTITQALFLTVR